MTELRAERPEDVPGIRDVLSSAFETPAEAGLVASLRADEAWLPGLSVVAVEDRVIAYALLSRIVVSGGTGDVPALALGPVAVLPERQRQGYGTAVIREALARATGERLVIVLGDPKYYRRFGFVPGASVGITGPWSEFGDAWQVLPLHAPPEPGEARYPPPWTDL